jgi:pimeloyl-ACP methyl ester carboxylesterase
VSSLWEHLFEGDPVAFALVALAIVAALLLFGLLHLFYWSRRLALALEYREVRRIETPDGAHVELRRVPLPVEKAALPPILLVHGIAANHRNQDLTHEESLARHLAALGRDVWLVTLRSGLRPASRADARKKTFAAMVANDVPWAIDAVLATTDAPCLDYVGFSMGGMLLYAALARTVVEEKVRRVVLVGSPGKIVLHYPVPCGLLRLVPRALVPTLPLRLGARMFAFMSEWFPTPLHKMVVNPRNVGEGVTRLALVNVIEDSPAALNADFLAWAANGGELVVGSEPMLAPLAHVGIPALFVAGSADRIAPPSAVQRAFEAWASDRPEVPKRFVVLGRDYDAREDYGHGDLAVGAYVGVEIFPLVARFLGPEEATESHRAVAGGEAVAEVERRSST